MEEGRAIWAITAITQDWIKRYKDMDGRMDGWMDIQGVKEGKSRTLCIVHLAFKQDPLPKLGPNAMHHGGRLTD